MGEQDGPALIAVKGTNSAGPASDHLERGEPRSWPGRAESTSPRPGGTGDPSGRHRIAIASPKPCLALGRGTRFVRQCPLEIAQDAPDHGVRWPWLSIFRLY